MTNLIHPNDGEQFVFLQTYATLMSFFIYRMKTMQDKQQGLRTRLRNNQRELQRLMKEYENFGAIVVTGDQVPGMKEWLVNDRPRRRAPVVRSPDPLDNTQTTDGSTQPSQSTIANSQISDAASDIFPDDYTASSEEEVEEERSVDTETGLPDTQASDSPYRTRSQKKKRRKKKAKKASKKEKRRNKKNGGKRSPPNSPSY